LSVWCGGNGYSDWQSVAGDLSQLGTDSGNNDLVSVESDGGQLARDAVAALQNVPPGTRMEKFNYAYVMSALTIVGLKLNQGEYQWRGFDSQSCSADDREGFQLG
jgi:hypothetical protein